MRQLRNESKRIPHGPPAGSSPIPPRSCDGGDKHAEGSPRIHGRRTSLASAVESLEREMIEGALERADGNISETARFLGLTRRGLYLKMQRLGVSAARV